MDGKMTRRRGAGRFAWVALAPALGAAICLGTQAAPSGESAAKPAPAPLDYAARTDTRPEPLPDKPPLIGPAGSIVKDPAFGSRILRVTDANTLQSKGFSFLTPSAGWANNWNKTSTRFFVLSRGGRRPVFNFDPVEMTSHFSGLDVSQSLGWMAAEFSYLNPDLIYGIHVEHDHHPKLQQYDFSVKRVTDIGDPESCVKMEPTWSAIDLSVSASAEAPRLVSALGPQQDKDSIVYVHDPKLGCRWYNTMTGEVGGDWGSRGNVSTEERFGVHAVSISPSGDYAYIAAGYVPPGGGKGHNELWRIDSTEVRPCDEMCGGHWVLGYSHLINNAGSADEMDTVLRPLNNLRSITHVIPSFPPGPAWGADRHYSWNNDNPEDTAPVCASTYLNPSAPRGEAAIKAQPGLAETGVPIERAWDDEVVCVETDGKGSRVWRFAHTFSAATNGFWSEPRGNVSQDGRFYMFTSDWLSTLGKDPQVPTHRLDVFVVELK
jgi:hypothetical protein